MKETNLEIACKLLGYQGGTVHQISIVTGISINQILESKDIKSLIKYEKWIAENVQTFNDAYGLCDQVTKKMLSVFPELKRVRGHYQCTISGSR